MLKNGERIKSESGFEYSIARKLGGGGQGEIYEVKQGKSFFALKWYFEHTATEIQKNTIKNLIKKGEPGDEFLWPKDLLLKGRQFGYIMPLRPSKYKSIPDMMHRRAEPTFHALCIVGANLAAGYRKLHLTGYSYRDISFGNVFFNPENGDILICDNDNVSVDGLGDSSVRGTPGFMAPEIETGEKQPSTDTDLFSLAVLLFYVFMVHHPFHGAIEAKIKCLDPRAYTKLYATNPVFIWNPTDKTNRPVKGYQDNAIIYWNIYPDFIRGLFTKAFTEGIREPKKRIVEKVWQDAFASLLNSIICCPKCGAETFFDEGKHIAKTLQTCWKCDTPILLPPAIQIGKNRIFLNKNGRLLQHHTKDDYDFKTVIGEVVQNPDNPARWGIKNVSDDSWTFIKPDGPQATINEGKAAPIIRGAKINFGNVLGEYN